MAMPGTWDTELYIGDSWAHTFDFTDTDTGEAIDLTGYTPSFQIRTSKWSDTAIDWSEHINVSTVATDGGLTLVVPPSETAELEERIYYFDLQLATADDADVRTYVAGKIDATKDVSR